MNNGPDIVHIEGDPVSAWLVASTIVRFCGIDPLNVSVNECGEWDPHNVFIRPETAPLHKSIGLDASKLTGARRVNVWAEQDHKIPLSPFGAPLKGASFHNIWARFKRTSNLQNLWEYQSASPNIDAYLVPRDHYAEALKEIAISAGMRCDNDCEHPPYITISSLAPGNEACVERDIIRVGTALVRDAFHSDLSLYALDISLRVLISNWPRSSAVGFELKEYQRRVLATLDQFSEMQALLNNRLVPNESLRYRINVWRELGRIIPVDSDPFTEQEWIGALLHAGHEPTGYPRIVDAISEEDAHRHLNKCPAHRHGYDE